MSITGSPSLPTVTLVNAASVAAAASAQGSTNIGPGFQRAMVEVVCDQQFTVNVFGSGAADDTNPAQLYELVTVIQAATQAATGAGRAYMINCRTLACIKVSVTNTGASPATVSVFVTLA